MKAIVKFAMFVVVLSGLPLLANAESWKAIEGLDGQYVDLDSASRNGDLATISKRRLNAGFVRKDTLTFDCSRNTLEEVNGMVPVPKELEPVFDKACSRINTNSFWKWL